MDEIYIAYKSALMSVFNDVCHNMADNIATLLTEYIDQNPEQATLFAGFPIAIDDWWNLDDANDQNYMTKYIRNLDNIKKENSTQYERELKGKVEGFKEMYPRLSGHFDAIIKNPEWGLETTVIRYIPHVVEYAYPDFVKLDGFLRLNEMCRIMGNVALDVVLEVNDNAESLLADDAYHFAFLFTAYDGETLPLKVKKLSFPNQRLN